MKVAKEEDGIVADWQGLAVWETRKSSRREVVRFAQILCFCFLVVKRLGLTNELRASEDKLQGFLVVREVVPGVAGCFQMQRVMGTRLIMKLSVA